MSGKPSRKATTSNHNPNSNSTSNSNNKPNAATSSQPADSINPVDEINATHDQLQSSTQQFEACHRELEEGMRKQKSVARRNVEAARDMMEQVVALATSIRKEMQERREKKPLARSTTPTPITTRRRNKADTVDHDVDNDSHSTNASPSHSATLTPGPASPSQNMQLTEFNSSADAAKLKDLFEKLEQLTKEKRESEVKMEETLKRHEKGTEDAYEFARRRLDEVMKFLNSLKEKVAKLLNIALSTDGKD